MGKKKSFVLNIFFGERAILLDQLELHFFLLIRKVEKIHIRFLKGINS